MAELALYRSDVASLAYDVSSHGVPGCMGSSLAHLGYDAGMVPHLVDDNRVGKVCLTPKIQGILCPASRYLHEVRFISYSDSVHRYDHFRTLLRSIIH